MLRLSPYSNTLSFEKMMIMKMLKEDGETKAETFRQSLLFTNDDDPHGRFMNYLVHTDSDLVSEKLLKGFWYDGEDSRHLGYNMPLEKHMKKCTIVSFCMTAPIMHVMQHHAMPHLPVYRKLFPSIAFGLFLGANSFYQSHRLWQKSTCNIGTKIRWENEEIYAQFLEAENEYFQEKINNNGKE